VTNVLVVTTTVGVLHRVHGATAHLGPRVALHAVLVEGAAGLEHWLVGAAAAGHDAYHGAAPVGESALGARRQADTGGALVEIVGHDRRVVARAPGNLASISRGRLDVAHQSTLRHLRKRQDVAYYQLGLLAAVDELTRVGALRSADELRLPAILVDFLELHAGYGSTPTRLVEDLYQKEELTSLGDALSSIRKDECVKVSLSDAARQCSWQQVPRNEFSWPTCI